MSDENTKADEMPTGAASELSAGLAACPCGAIPEELHIMDCGQGGKWAFVYGSCCGDWYVEFRTGYFALDSSECKSLAREAWNKTKRAANV